MSGLFYLPVCFEIVTPLDFSFIAKKEMKKWPLIGRWMRRFDCIFLDRKNARQGMKDMKEAIDKIKKGHSYVIFPEKRALYVPREKII